MTNDTPTNDTQDEHLPDQDTAATETVEPASDPLAERDAQIAELEDRLKRAIAETENVRRRLEREKTDASTYAVTSFARDLLAVADNMARALAALPAEASSNDALKPIITGIEMTEKELFAVFGRHGISRVEALGQSLDPNRHQAMLEVESDAHEPGTIVQELQSGYLIKDRLLRPALVSVAKAKG